MTPGPEIGFSLAVLALPCPSLYRILKCKFVLLDNSSRKLILTPIYIFIILYDLE